MSEQTINLKHESLPNIQGKFCLKCKEDVLHLFLYFPEPIDLKTYWFTCLQCYFQGEE